MFEDPLPPNGRPPRRRRHLWITFAVVMTLVFVGAITTGVLLGNRDTEPRANPAPPPAPTSEPWTPPQAPPPRVPGWQVGYNAEFQVAYDVPGDWRVLPPEEGFPVPSLGDVEFRGLANGPGYSCGGRNRVPGTAGSTAVEATKTLEKTAVQFAGNMGRTLYAAAHPQVRVGQPQPVTVDGVEGVRVEATVIMPPGPPCSATESKLGIIVLKGKDSYVVVVAAGESARPAPQPPAEGAVTVPRVLDSVRPVK